MFLKLQPFLCSLVFLIGLEFIVIFHRHVPIILFFLLLISLYQSKIVGKKWKFSILPIFFTLSSVSLLYLVTARLEQQLFIFLATFLYYLALFGFYRLSRYDEDLTARGMIMAATMSAIFFIYAGTYGLYLNFLVPLYILMLTYLISTLLVSYQYFSLIYPKNKKGIFSPKKTVWLYSFVLALAMAEIVWSVNFWPFGYLTTGTVALILYYVLWDIIQSHFLGNLKKKKVITNLIILSILAFLVLVTSKWIPTI